MKFLFTKKLATFLVILSVFSLTAKISLCNQTNYQTLKNKSEYLNFVPNQFSNSGEPIVQVWNSPEGIKRLVESKYNNDFYQLANFYQPQINPLYCGIASSVIILNSLRSAKDEIASQKELEVKKPQALGGGIITFKSYSQSNFLNQDTDKIKNNQVVRLENLSEIEANSNKADPGFALNDLAKVLNKIYKLKVKTIHVKDAKTKNIQKFRDLLKQVLANQTSYLLVNFDAKTLGFRSRGHFSPLAAYDDQSDLVLVLDVATHERPWYWVPVSALYQAMNTKDSSEYRGYLIISE